MRSKVTFATVFLKSKVFSVVFLVSSLSLSAITFLTLCLSRGTRQTSVFFLANDSFMDFFNVLKYIAGRDPYNGAGLGERAYPPLTYMILYPFSRLFDFTDQAAEAAKGSQLGIMSVVIFLVFLSIAFALLLYECKTGSRALRFWTLIALLSSGIMLFSLERANIIFLAAIGVLFFVMFYKSENRALRELAYIALAVATALKVYPALFGVLLLYDKKYLAALRLTFYGLVAGVAPFLFFAGGFANLPLLLNNVKENTQTYIYTAYGYRFGLIAEGLLFGLSEQSCGLLIAASFVLAAIAILTAWSLRKPWQTILALTCVLLITPMNSAYYCGLYFFLPIIMFLNEQEHRPVDWLYLLLMILVLNPYQIIYEQSFLTTAIANSAVIMLYLLICGEGAVSCIGNIRGRLKRVKT